MFYKRNERARNPHASRDSPLMDLTIDLNLSKFFTNFSF